MKRIMVRQGYVRRSGLTDGEDTGHEVHVSDVECERLPWPQACGGKQAEKCPERGGAQSKLGPQSIGGGHQIGNLPVGVDVRRRSAMLCGQKPLRRNLRPRVRRMEKRREPSHDPEPACERRALDAYGLDGPTHRELRGHKLRAFAFDEVDEPPQ
jgi:hypothetical protein